MMRKCGNWRVEVQAGDAGGPNEGMFVVYQCQYDESWQWAPIYVEAVTTMSDEGLARQVAALIAEDMQRQGIAVLGAKKGG